MKKILTIIAVGCLMIGMSNTAMGQSANGCQQCDGKEKTVGKKKASGSIMVTFDGELKGESVGYEVKTGKGKTAYLDNVGLYVADCNCDGQAESMTFEINVYEMTKENGHSAPTFTSVLDAPIPFTYNYSEVVDGKFTFALPQRIKLPQNALVTITATDNFPDGKGIFFKGSFMGSRMWMYSPELNEWDKLWFSMPFFFNYVECK